MLEPYRSNIYIRSDGTIYENSNTWKLYPNAQYTNILAINLEDGSLDNTFVEVCYVWNIAGEIQKSEWLPLFAKSNYTLSINDDAVVFHRHEHFVPIQILSLAQPNAIVNIGVQVRLVQGTGWQGIYDTYEDLIGLLPASEELVDNEALVFVLDNNTYYQCQNVGDTPTWVSVEFVDTYQESKSYNIEYLALQVGIPNPKPTVSISTTQTNAIFLELYAQSLLIQSNRTNIEIIQEFIAQNDIALFTIVQTLPTQNQNPNTIYVIVDSEDDTIYHKWLWVDNAWVSDGTVNIDLTSLEARVTALEQAEGSPTVGIGAIKIYASVEDADGEGYNDGDSVFIVSGSV